VTVGRGFCDGGLSVVGCRLSEPAFSCAVAGAGRSRPDFCGR
jgi:hypothetical protein